MSLQISQENKSRIETVVKTAERISGSDLLVKTLVGLGVEVVFGYPGGASMPIHDSLFKARGKIRHILTRHEQGAAHMAEGYGRATGRAGVCLVTSGPGATNLVTGIADAMMDSVPMVCFTGQVPASVIGTDAFQETDVIGITAPITKWSYQITSADEIPYIISKAFYIAETGRPGPVVIDIAKNAQFEETNPDNLRHFSPKDLKSYRPNYEPLSSDIKKAAELINKAERPLVLVGRGVIISRAEGELIEFLEKADLPAACTLHGLSAISKDHPNFVGMLGMHGNYSPNILTNKADVLIALGMRFDDRVTGNLKKYAPQAKVIHVEIDPAEIDKNVKTFVGINADVRKTLQKLIPLLKKRARKSWFKNFRDLFEVEREKVIDKQIKNPSENILMAEVIHNLSQLTAGKANIIADVGQNQMMAARYYQFRRFNSFFSSGGMGTMGYALPAAIGVKVARPKEIVVAIAGDGGIQMTLQELAVLSQDNLDVKVIVLNNEFLGMVRQWQELFFEKRYAFTKMQNPDFVRLAKAFGIASSRVGRKSDLRKALSQMIEHKGPYLLEIMVEKEDMVFPMVPAGASLQDILLEV